MLAWLSLPTWFHRAHGVNGACRSGATLTKRGNQMTDANELASDIYDKLTLSTLTREEIDAVLEEVRFRLHRMRTGDMFK